MNNVTDNPGMWRSGRFTVAPSAHARLKMEDLAARRWWVAAVPVCVLLVMGAADWRFWIVAGMLVFAVLPLVVLMGWLQALRSEGALLSVYDMEAEVDYSGDMTLRFFRKRRPSEDPDENDDADRKGNPDSDDDADISPAHAPVLLPRVTLRDVRLWRGNVVMTYDRMEVIILLADDSAASLPRLLELTGMRESHNFV